MAQAQVVDVAPNGTQTYINTYQYNSTSNTWIANPITINSADSYYLVLYGTGIRGASAGQVTATVGGLKATVVYAGAQPVFAGLDQVNLQLPSGLAGAGSVNVALSVNGEAANTVTVTFQ